MAKRERFDYSRPDARALRDRIVHGAFVTEGAMVAFPTCFPAVTVPLPGDESRITALDVAEDGMVYAGAGGRACHLLVGMFHGITGMVFDLGQVPGADRAAGVCCGKGKFVAAVNGPDGGQLITRRLEPLPFDLIQEWHIARRPLERLSLPASAEPIVHAVAAAGRDTAVVLTEGRLLAVDIEAGSVRTVGELAGRGRIARGPDGAVYGLDGSASLWRYDAGADRLERGAVALPPGQWGPGIAWAPDAGGALSYLADEAGALFVLDASGTVHGPVAQVPLAPVTCMAVTFDGRLFGSAGEGMSRLFRFTPGEPIVADLGVAVSVFERRRYGYSFADAAVGRDGEIVFAENDDLGHVWLYFPRIQARQGGSA